MHVYIYCYNETLVFLKEVYTKWNIEYNDVIHTYSALEKMLLAWICDLIKTIKS